MNVRAWAPMPILVHNIGLFLLIKAYKNQELLELHPWCHYWPHWTYDKMIFTWIPWKKQLFPTAADTFWRNVEHRTLTITWLDPCEPCYSAIGSCQRSMAFHPVYMEVRLIPLDAQVQHVQSWFWQIITKGSKLFIFNGILHVITILAAKYFGSFIKIGNIFCY